MKKATYKGEEILEGTPVLVFEYYGYEYFIQKDASETEQEQQHHNEQTKIKNWLLGDSDDWNDRILNVRTNNI